MRRVPAFFAATICGAVQVAAAQGSDALYTRIAALSGWEIRGFTFDSSGISTKSASQWRIPMVATVPVGRKISVDLTSNIVSGHVENYGGQSLTLTGLSDTQLRLLYTLGRDRMVASLSLNLPTGKQLDSLVQVQLAGTAGSNYLSFPVSTIRTAFGATGGLAYAKALGSWNLGLSGSLRYLGAYSPVRTDSGVYSPGMEFRIRSGVDRLIGRNARLLLGLSVSTFSSDDCTGSVICAGKYTPGLRLISEFGFVRVIGKGTVTLTAWDFYRTAGSINDVTSEATRENIFNTELRYSHPVSRRLTLEPMLGFRQWNPADSTGGYRGGRLKTFGLTARARLADQWSANLAGRFDDGWIFLRGRGFAPVSGYGFTVFVRYQR